MRFLNRALAVSVLSLAGLAAAVAVPAAASASVHTPSDGGHNFTNCHTSWTETWGPLQTHSHITDKSDRDGWTRHETQNCTDPCGDTWKGDGSQWQVTAYFDNDGGRNVCCEKHNYPVVTGYPLPDPRPVTDPCTTRFPGYPGYTAAWPQGDCTQPCPPKTGDHNGGNGDHNGDHNGNGGDNGGGPGGPGDGGHSGGPGGPGSGGGNNNWGGNNHNPDPTWTPATA